ncbi:hypothetical protein EAT49_09990 [Histidinibacterium lentulum]|uniref:Muramidase n=2 Tax=Histidinibacterium lentulum TaxID=2480588 RepID=A0A3N2R638_9RHOB|nr:hypothetical protein EAT49_09990 [Histidinibacterium lentulum]
MAAAAQGPSLFAAAGAVRSDSVAAAGPSTFIGQDAAGFFAPWPDRAPAPLRQAAAPLSGGGGPVARLRDLIAAAEAGPAGYDAVQHGARIRPPAPPTRLTIGQIDDWIRATPGQPHAIGRYQFIPPTFRRLVRQLGLPRDAPFSPAVQDRMADILLVEAGLERFLAGEIGRVDFMNRLARVWAGLPTSSGRSHYHGYAGNRATKSWAEFHGAMTAIFPGSRA